MPHCVNCSEKDTTAWILVISLDYACFTTILVAPRCVNCSKKGRIAVNGCDCNEINSNKCESRAA